jgi:hypothetical protein
MKIETRKIFLEENGLVEVSEIGGSSKLDKVLQVLA